MANKVLTGCCCNAPERAQFPPGIRSLNSLQSAACKPPLNGRKESPWDAIKTKWDELYICFMRDILITVNK